MRSPGLLLDQNAWWLFFNGEWAGYYPVSLYQGGALASGAGIVDFGGETVRGQRWPPMGSGAFPSAGFGHAAFQRNSIFYPLAGGDALEASLSPEESSPNCYKVLVSNSSGTTWGTYLLFRRPWRNIVLTNTGLARRQAMGTRGRPIPGNIDGRRVKQSDPQPCQGTTRRA